MRQDGTCRASPTGREEPGRGSMIQPTARLQRLFGTEQGEEMENYFREGCDGLRELMNLMALADREQLTAAIEILTGEFERGLTNEVCGVSPPAAIAGKQLEPAGR